MRFRASAVGCLVITLLCSAIRTPAQDSALSPEERRAQQVLERFLSVLESRPRFGVALDRVYGHHVERGTLEDLCQTYRDRIAADETDGTAWMVLGMIEFQRGRDAEAVAAFRGATEQLSDDPMAPYYLGQSLVLVGRPDEAVEAFETAVSREPERSDLLEIYQALGRVHQRAQRNEEALAVWDRLEGQFPDDVRVKEEIARTLADEGDNEGALFRYEKLAQIADDRYQQVQYAVKAAELKFKLGRSDDGITDLEALLRELRPDSWLHRDVRQRIEEVFLRTDDYAGLAEYYEKWLERNPDDVDAMTRLGEALAIQGRIPEAQQWFAKAIERAPTDTSLRLAYIEQLVAERKFAEAVEQYEQLDKVDPDNPDYIAEWGRLIAEDKSLDKDERRERASKVWKRLIDARPDDPVIITQVADLHRHAELNVIAIELYQRAVKLAPEDPQYREYLGEFYHRLKRSEEALATWRGIIDGDQRTTRNLVRLAEVFDGFGYTAEAIETMLAACDMDPEFSDRLRFAQLLREENSVDPALEQLALAQEMAETPDERQMVLTEQIKCYQVSGELVTRINSLESDLASGTKSSADDWQTLALYYEAERNLEEATRAVREAIQIDEQSVAVWTAAARIFEASGQLSDAADANIRLSELDRRYLTEYLTEITRLRLRLGQTDEALQTAADLIAAAPGNPEHYQFYASVCFETGRTDEGLDALRRSVAVNPADEEALLALASALSDQFRTDEAIELYWRAFERAGDLDGQITIVARLTELYLRTNHFDRLVSRLEAMGRDLDRERDSKICLANAYSSAGDLGMARFTLESLVSEETRDNQLMSQLVRLAELEDDFESAIMYQRRINELAPSPEGSVKLANLLTQSGELDEAELAWTRIVEQSDESHQVYLAIDRLIQSEHLETALAMTERILRDDPKDWEALTRRSVALWKSDQHAAAVEQSRRLLALTTADEEPSAAVLQQQQRRAGSGARSSGQAMYPEFMQRTNTAYELRRVLGVDPDAWRYGGRATWTPQSFGQARVGALMVLVEHALEENTETALMDEFRSAAEAESATPRSLWDWYYLLTVRPYSGGVSEGFAKDIYAVTRRLSEGLDPEACAVYLNSLMQRNVQQSPDAATTTTEPLSDEDLDHMLACFKAARGLSDTYMYWSNMASLSPVMRELKLAGREEQAQQLYDDVLTSAATDADLYAALSVAAERSETTRALELAGDIEQRSLAAGSSGGSSQRYFGNLPDLLAQLMARRVAVDNHDDALEIFDFYLDAMNARQAARSASQRLRSSTSSNPPYIQVYQATPLENGEFRIQNNYTQLTYPVPNDHFDAGGLTVLRNAYEGFLRDDVLSDLTNHLEDSLEQANDSNAISAHLALCYIHWWQGAREEAAEEMAAAAAAALDDVSLRLQLALMQHELGETETALETIDAVEPVNHVMLQQRELMALQLSVLTGDLERSRVAGERLFGLRLDTDVLLQLADYMHQAGMHDLAEALLSRARRRAGNQASSQLGLMRHYQNTGDTDTAVEIAYQVLRRSGRGGGGSGGGNVDAARQQAIQVLSQSGRLDELISRAVEQLERSPNSLALHQTLVDYYRAAGDQEKTKEMLQKVAELRPDDAATLYDIAQQLVSSGDKDAACDFYLKALKAQPSLLSRDYYSIQRAFQETERTDDFVAFLSETDLRKVGQYYYVTDMVQSLLQNEKTREQGLKLFERMWEAFAAERSYMLGNIYQDEVWKLPVMYDYVREAVIPDAANTLQSPWLGINDYNVLQRLLQAAQSQNKLDELFGEVESGLEKVPTWHAGAAILAAIDARRGRFDDSRRRLTELMDEQGKAIPLQARYQVALVLRQHNELTQELIRLYEEGMHEYQAQNWGWGSGPKTELAELYVKADRKEDARTTLLEAWNQQGLAGYGYPPGYEAYARISTCTELAQHMTNAGFPIDALRMYNEATSNPADLEQARQYGGDYYIQRLKQGREEVEKALTPDVLVESLRRWVAVEEVDGSSDDSDEPTADAIELFLSAQPNSLREARVASLFERALTAVADRPEELAQVQTQLELAREKRPNDLSIDIVSALLSLAAAPEQGLAEAELQRLTARLQQMPLDELEEGDRPNARQRAQARAQLGLWLVARAAAKRPETQDAAERLSERALEAARRQADELWALAMLRERGEAALQAGDRDTAEAQFREMLDLVVPERK